MKNKKLKAALSITGYLLLTLALCFTGGMVFHSYYYELIYVSGNSMAPTLNGAENDSEGSLVDFGIVDNHKSAIDHIKRFTIVSTYYPNSEAYNKDYNNDGSLKKSATKKIKRVIALPNETFEIKDGLLSVDGESISYPFTVEQTTAKDTDGPITLEDNQYWVLGDNRKNSTDSSTVGPIKKDNLIGVLVAIEGKAKLKVKKYICDNCDATYDNPSSQCSKCHTGHLNPEYDLVDKVYSWPKYY